MFGGKAGKLGSWDDRRQMRECIRSEVGGGKG